MSSPCAAVAKPPVASPVALPAAPPASEGRFELDALPLVRGGVLAPARIAWRLAGTPGTPVVAALGGISADRRVTGDAGLRPGWWDALAGPGLPLDTRRFQVLGIDWLTAPGAGIPVDSRDQARALLAACDHLGIRRLHALVGASYGGMVGLALAEIAPARIGRLLAISAAHRSNALATAWRAVQREIVRHAAGLGDGAGGLRIARALAMTTYRTRAELDARFPTGDGAGTRGGFAVADYLFARGDDFARRHTPESFLSLSESIDLHRVEPSRIATPVTLVAVLEDQLVPPGDLRELAAGLAGPCRLVELHSTYGHDAFLKERALLAPAFAAALEGEGA